MKTEVAQPWLAVGLAARAASRVLSLYRTAPDEPSAKNHRAAVESAAALARRACLEGTVARPAALKAFTEALIAVAAARAGSAALGLQVSQGCSRVALAAAFAVELALDAGQVLGRAGGAEQAERDAVAAAAVNVTLSSQDAVRGVLGEGARKAVARAVLADFKWLRAQDPAGDGLAAPFLDRPLWPEGTPEGF